MSPDPASEIRQVAGCAVSGRNQPPRMSQQYLSGRSWNDAAPASFEELGSDRVLQLCKPLANARRNHVGLFRSASDVLVLVCGNEKAQCC